MTRSEKSKRGPDTKQPGDTQQARDRQRPGDTKRPADSKHARGAQARQLRIIGGTWRGRRFRFPASSQIRPTPDRVRETLFNWLGNHVSGARCLDLFAGSGALGLEALSRGAAEVTFVERDSAATSELATLLSEWGARGARVERGDALQFLRGPVPAQPFDIVFLDPPFAAGLLQGTAELLESRRWVADAAYIYVECAAREGLPPLPAPWVLAKAKQAGEVGYHLLAR